MGSEYEAVSKNIKVCLACEKDVELPLGHKLNVCPHCAAVQSTFAAAKATQLSTPTSKEEVGADGDQAGNDIQGSGVTKNIDFLCPKCGYEHTQRVEIVYETGSHTSAGAAIGAGASGIGVGVGVSQTQSALSAKLAPPKALNPDTSALVVLCMVVVVGIFAAMLNETLGMLVFVVGIVLAVSVSRSAVNYNKEKLPALVEEWRRKFFCHRCGEIFVPSKRNSSRPR